MERMLRATIENEPEVLMRVTALLKRKGFQMKRIVMQSDDDQKKANLEITMQNNGPALDAALLVLKRVVNVYSVVEVKQ
ncbi:ACT domain-containing protein [Fusibacter bizertensis]|uniref:ACT domain-containing protein n=1 Tax=Fusibacter bizertensis TaxID=1488331 RepID=A0ABT6NF60_9FIRM|nr:ACT domain-containing protein [Fusibacter bizertensis]MDH8679069.1 ACT domain-containing protein [Fusibacter bizertensis]